MAIKRRLKTAADELRACLSHSRYAEPIREIAGNVIAGLGAAQIGAKINLTVKEQLLEDVAKLQLPMSSLWHQTALSLWR